MCVWLLPVWGPSLGQGPVQVHSGSNHNPDPERFKVSVTCQEASACEQQMNQICCHGDVLPGLLLLRHLRGFWGAFHHVHVQITGSKTWTSEDGTRFLIGVFLSFPPGKTRTCCLLSTAGTCCSTRSVLWFAGQSGDQPITRLRRFLSR